MKERITFKDFPRWLNPNLSLKQIERCYKDEIEEIDRIANWRKSPIKVPGYPGAYYCVVVTDSNYIKLQR